MFRDRTEAGRILADRIARPAGRCTVTGIARGGIITARPVAEILGCELTTIIVKKIGHPDDPEFAIGAVAEGMERRPYLNSFSSGIDRETVQYAVSRLMDEIGELRRTLGSANSVFNGRWDNVIVVDDGSATGTTVVAAVRSIKINVTKNVLVAVPVISEDAFDLIRSEGVDIVYVDMPYDFEAVSEFYSDFREVSVDDIRSMLYG
ncbi:phosphoribosyltransferase [Thermoplasma sp. Kam2015]|uniref:phosphoribosyltransferase n=1 Tax=Thermoplasma sp. Kam2015 TaxID=2094122 RepID=UPI000D8F88C4|nr:phosphoribosyltransferase [Thermoplasma sp. Kam2015]PYB68986.1 phosphoribosyltransferase [Thermoplasma sp. Kam2015]